MAQSTTTIHSELQAWLLKECGARIGPITWPVCHCLCAVVLPNWATDAPNLVAFRANVQAHFEGTGVGVAATTDIPGWQPDSSSDDYYEDSDVDDEDKGLDASKVVAGGAGGGAGAGAGAGAGTESAGGAAAASNAGSTEPVELLSVPEKAMLTLHSDTLGVLKHLRQHSEGLVPPLTLEEALQWALLVEWARDAAAASSSSAAITKSHFAAYLATLPAPADYSGMPTMWSDAQLAALDHPVFAAQQHSRIQRQSELHATLAASAATAASATNSSLDAAAQAVMGVLAAAVGLDRVMWAHNTVSSRSFLCEWLLEPVLVPAADM